MNFTTLILSTFVAATTFGAECQLTFEPRNHELDNNDSFSPDSQWLAFDTRDDATAIAGNAIIARVNLASGEIQQLYCEPGQQPWGPGVGAANVSLRDGRLAFIRGLVSATKSRPYEMWRRTAAMVDPDEPGKLHLLDARDVIAPFTPGALRGGTHRHEWSADGRWIGFTYNDALLAEVEAQTGEKVNLRTIGVATWRPGGVTVPSGPENHDGEMISAVVARVVPQPRPDSDEISRAFEDAWVGREGYRQSDGGWQNLARAFLGNIRTKGGQELTEVFIVDLPHRIDVPGKYGPLEGSATTMPNPPHGCTQRRLTFTEERRYPGVALTPRHWVRSSPDGTRIVFLAYGNDGVVQAFLVSPNGGPVTQVTQQNSAVQSAVRWSPDGRHLLYICANAVTICGAEPGQPEFGKAHALTVPSVVTPESPVWSPDGRSIAFNRRVPAGDGVGYHQIFLISSP